MTLISNFWVFTYYKMLSIKRLNKKDIDLCYELDSNTISLWSKKQWAKELKKKRYKSVWDITFKLINRNMRFSCSS